MLYIFVSFPQGKLTHTTNSTNQRYFGTGCLTSNFDDFRAFFLPRSQWVREFCAQSGMTFSMRRVSFILHWQTLACGVLYSSHQLVLAIESCQLAYHTSKEWGGTYHRVSMLCVPTGPSYIIQQHPLRHSFEVHRECWYSLHWLQLRSILLL